MLIVKAINICTHEDGTADYDVRVFVNEERIWWGTISNHVRGEGAAVLLGYIAERMQHAKQREKESDG